MLFARLVLLVQALVWCGLGLLYWLRPYEMANLSGMLLMEPSSVSDAQVFYGGHQFALALFLFFALRRAELLQAGLILVLLVQLTLTLSRLFVAWSSGSGIDGDASLYGLLYRGGISVLALLALYWLERRKAAPPAAAITAPSAEEKLRAADFEGL